MTTPQQALEACRDAGFREGEWVRDVRAGRCRIETLTPTLVRFATEDGQPLALDGACVLLKSYHNGSIEPIEGK